MFASPQELLAARSLWDALLIAVPPQATLPILKEAVALGVPILVEKPVACAAAELKPLLEREAPVIVGYNRRFTRLCRHSEAWWPKGAARLSASS